MQICIQQAHDLDPNNTDWLERLARAYESSASSNSDSELFNCAVKLRQELVARLAQDDHRLPMELVRLAGCFYRAEDFEQSKTCSERVLSLTVERSIRTADAVHKANTLIGLVRLRDNDVSGACDSLLAAAQVTGTPVLMSFGPQWELANKVLGRGQRSIAVRYIQDCSEFWESGQVLLAYWWLGLKLGLTPKLDRHTWTAMLLPSWLNPAARQLLSAARGSKAK